MNDLNTLFPELTTKQYACLEWYALGLQMKNIADKCGVSEDTVKHHFSTLKRKFGCSSSYELRAIYLSRVVTNVLKKAH